MNQTDLNDTRERQEMRHDDGRATPTRAQRAEWAAIQKERQAAEEAARLAAKRQNERIH